MYKLILVCVFSIFNLVLSATVPDENVIRSNSSDATTRQVFVIKMHPDGTPLQRCQCTEFHQCDRGDIYDPSLNQDWIRCDNRVHVCCVLKNGNSLTSVPVNAANTPLVKSSDQQTPEDEHCTCVSFDKCANESYVANYGQGIIGVRISSNQQCADTSLVCCPDSYIKNEDTRVPAVAEEPESVTPPQSPERPEANPETPLQLSSEITPIETSPAPVPTTTSAPINVEQLFIPSQTPQSQCSCVRMDACKNDSVTDSHGAGVIQLRAPLCDVTEVCCLVSDLVAETAPLSLDSTSKSNATDGSSEQECGLRKGIATRISSAPDSSPDSTYTSFGEYPWMVSILKMDIEAGKPKMFCGGSLVSSNMVLTAAHCVHKIEPEKLIVRAGEYDFEASPDQEQQPHQDRSVLEIRVHPFYREGVVFNDMALLILDEEFQLKSHISSICLPLLNSKFADSDLYDPTKCIATGWGKETHEQGGTYQNSLKKVDLSLVDYHECEAKLRKTRLGPKFMLHSSFICAGGELGKDTCQGDGGGPLFCALREKPDRYVQVGITSWGLDCGQLVPGVYSNVKANAKWLTVEINMSSIFARGATSKKPKMKSSKRI